jgi:formate/nitrite transporter FocA (FNT family)
LVCWSIVARKIFHVVIDFILLLEKDIHLFVDVLSSIFGTLIVVSFGNCFLGILSMGIVDFFLSD